MSRPWRPDLVCAGCMWRGPWRDGECPECGQPLMIEGPNHPDLEGWVDEVRRKLGRDTERAT